MTFLAFPINFAEDDFEKKENLGLEITHEEGVIVINTHQIVSYNEMDGGNVLVRMSNGDAYDCPVDIETFEEVLSETELITNLSDISEN